MATLILKATEKCNSNCYYCDVVRKAGSGNTMSFDILEKVFIRINEYLQTHMEEEIQLLWHGGEPLLVGVKYFEEALKFQNIHCHDTKTRIKHSIQTNLTCFNERFVGVFRELGITSIGTSYDPEPDIRGIGKKVDSIKYNKMFMQKLGILEKNNIGWGLIYVVTKKSLVKPRDVFYFLSNLLLTGGINFNPVLIYDEERKDIAITPIEYVQFLGEIFGHWWQHRQRYPDIEPFRSYVSNILDGQESLGCVDSGSCTYNHINVTPDGETSQCGRSADWGLLKYGNIINKSLSEILQDNQRHELELRNTMLPDKDCKGCRFWEICHGGCPLDAYSKYKSFMHKSEWCDAKRIFISKYFEPITGVKFKPRINQN